MGQLAAVVSFDLIFQHAPGGTRVREHQFPCQLLQFQVSQFRVSAAW